MTESEWTATYGEIYRLISEKRLKQAFSQIRKWISETRQGEWTDQLYNLEETYHYIRKYTMEGIEDPERGKVYQHLVRSLFELTGKMKDHWLTLHSDSDFYRKKRSAGINSAGGPDPFPGEWAFLLKEEVQSETGNERQKFLRVPPDYWQKIGSLFFRILCADRIDESGKTFFVALFRKESLLPELRSVLITALTFSLLRYFDEVKMVLLADLYENNPGQPLVSRRCLAGYLLALYHYDDMMAYYPQVGKRFDLMNENPDFNRNVENLMLQLLNSRETEKIREKIQKEIIPEMIRISPNLRNKFNLDNLMDAEGADDRNPEWSDLFQDSPGLFEKMEEMARMHSEGADVFLASFGMFKTFPFFQQMINWFVPFFPGHPDIPEVPQEEREDTETRITGALLHSPLLCNSDKYSFTLMLRHITGEARSMMAGFLQAEMEQIREEDLEEGMLLPGKKESLLSNQYIQDLYRFFRLYPFRNDFEDIFGWKFDFHNKAVFQAVLKEHPAMMKRLAGFYFEKGYYGEALEIFGRTGEEDGETLQKAAYCHQKLGQYSEALSLYLKAELYEVNRIWNLKKIAMCYRNLKLPEEALKAYQTLDTLQPENLNILVALGYCYSETGRYQEALNTFFKIEYLFPRNKKVWRPLAWCFFLTGKGAQAEKYYLKLLDENPDPYDLMNMGHVQWVLGKREPALTYYRMSILSEGFSTGEFMNSFREDLRFLTGQGISPDEIPLVLDQLLYSLEE